MKCIVDFKVHRGNCFGQLWSMWRFVRWFCECKFREISIWLLVILKWFYVIAYNFVSRELMIFTLSSLISSIFISIVASKSNFYTSILLTTLFLTFIFSRISSKYVLHEEIYFSCSKKSVSCFLRHLCILWETKFLQKSHLCVKVVLYFFKSIKHEINCSVKDIFSKKVKARQ